VATALHQHLSTGPALLARCRQRNPVRVDPLSGQHSTIASLLGFSRALDCFAGYAFVGLFKIRKAMGGHLWFTPVSSKYLLLQALPG